MQFNLLYRFYFRLQDMPDSMHQMLLCWQLFGLPVALLIVRQQLHQLKSMLIIIRLLLCSDDWSLLPLRVPMPDLHQQLDHLSLLPQWLSVYPCHV